MDYLNFISERTAKLRHAKGVSARDMSLSIGQNVNYINNIENRKAEPSMSGFIYICDYFRITPQEFFDIENTQPARLKDFVEDVKRLNDNQFIHLSNFLKEIVDAMR